MLSAFHERLEQWEVHNSINDAAPYLHTRYQVPDHAKDGIRQQLAMLNITEEVLMADLQSSAKAVADEVQGR